jgi:hypothetical protein
MPRATERASDGKPGETSVTMLPEARANGLCGRVITEREVYNASWCARFAALAA